MEGAAAVPVNPGGKCIARSQHYAPLSQTGGREGTKRTSYVGPLPCPDPGRGTASFWSSCLSVRLVPRSLHEVRSGQAGQLRYRLFNWFLLGKTSEPGYDSNGVRGIVSPRA